MLYIERDIVSQNNINLFFIFLGGRYNNISLENESQKGRNKNLS